MTSGSKGTELSTHPDGAVIALTVVPRSAKTGFDRVEHGMARLRVAAPPVEGAANAAVVRFLADTFDLPKGAVRIIAGATAGRQPVLLTGLPIDVARACLYRLTTESANA